MPATDLSTQPVVIDVQDVKKKFNVYVDRGATLKERVLFRSRRTYTEHWVLKGISFQVRKGEAIGLVGENGCGKSTTLKLLTKILYPDAGSITMCGRVSSLIELGAGFHPDMTGRENIYTNASIFGLSKQEIDSRLEEIIAFSELGQFIDNPVRTYSSGMYMRLAFAVAINVDADILLIDEILAVGDAAYQAKCLNKLREIKRKGTTIVIVSHSLGQIELFCERSIWIEDGMIREEGRPFDVHPKYLRFLNQKAHPTPPEPQPSAEDAGKADSEQQGDLPDASRTAEAPQDVQEDAPSTIENEAGNASPDTPEPEAVAEKPTIDSDNRWGCRDIYFESIQILDEEGNESYSLECGRPFTIVMNYRVVRPLEELTFGFGIFRNDGLQCYGTNTIIDRIPLNHEALGKTGQVKIAISNNSLIAGAYILDVAVQRVDTYAYDFYRNCHTFTVYSTVPDEGVTRLDHVWQFEKGVVAE